mmetsp:Transcript_13461/g.20250  ORF Transcript_13461/g.20250 Transcript_13461/m.20250 type:complete len:203 (-) Transcript_13461:154-762(-)
MSSDDQTPVAVTVSAYPQPQQVVATPVESGEANYGVPVYAQSVSASSPNTAYAQAYPPRVNVVIAGNPGAGSLTESIIRTVSLSRSMRCLTTVDGIIVLLLSIFNIYWLFFLWGPVCGYIGATRFKLNFTYVYVAYWGLRLVFDLLYAALGYWWFIISLLIDIYILRYVWLYGTILKSLTEQELEYLRTAEREMASTSRWTR